MFGVFSSKAPITPSGDFIVEILTGVWLCIGRLGQIGVSPSLKTEYPDDCITAARHVVSKVAAVEDRLI